MGKIQSFSIREFQSNQMVSSLNEINYLHVVKNIKGLLVKIKYFTTVYIAIDLLKNM